MGRKLDLLAIPTGDRVLDVLPALRRALAGTGSVLVPVAEDDTTHLGVALRASSELDDGEDDDDDPIAVMVATSGSTGRPKGVLLPASALTASADATRRRLASLPRNDPAQQAKHPSPDQWLLALSATHIAGLQVLLRAAWAGTEPTVLDTGETFTAERFCAAVQRMPGGRRYTSLVPTQLVRVLSDREATHALATFDAVLVGGAASPASLLRQARESGVTVVTTYGMTETCGGCVYDGLPLDGVAVSLEGGGNHDDASPSQDSAGASAVHGAGQGRVVLEGAVLARGYRGEPAHPAFTVIAGHRAFRTQDVGWWSDDRLRIVGRVDDVLVTGGVKVDPAAVESTLAAVDGVRDVLVTGVPDPEWGHLVVAVVVPNGPDAPSLEALRAAATSAHGRPAAPRHVVLVDKLPTRSIGKPDRRAVRVLAERAIEKRCGAGQGTESDPTHLT